VQYVSDPMHSKFIKIENPRFCGQNYILNKIGTKELDMANK